MRVRHYSDFLNSVAGLIGVQVTDLAASELAIITGFFNKGMKYAWQQTNWLDVCPYGEYRVPNNAVLFGKSLGNSNWTQTGTTSQSGLQNNPVDVQQDASAVNEMFLNGMHNVSQAITVFQTTYSLSCFAQAAGRNFIQVSLTDSTATVFSAVFNIAGNSTTGTVVSQSANVTVATIQNISGLWFQVMLNCTPAPGFATLTISLSTDGVTFSYPGNSGKGIYLWGVSAVPTQPSGVSQQLIPWEQVGEEPIDVVYDLFNTTPIASSYPSRMGYKLTNNGIQTINSTNGQSAMYYVQNPQAASTTTDASPLTPAYLSYRKRVPDYLGAVYNLATAYPYGAIAYYTFNAGYSDYVQCLFPNTGNSPDTFPADWKVLSIPYVFFDYAVYSVFADWLRTEGQMARAEAMDAFAEDILLKEADRQERQMGEVQSWKVQTHLTSRPNPLR